MAGKSDARKPFDRVPEAVGKYARPSGMAGKPDVALT